MHPASLADESDLTFLDSAKLHKLTRASHQADACLKLALRAHAWLHKHDSMTMGLHSKVMETIHGNEFPWDPSRKPHPSSCCVCCTSRSSGFCVLQHGPKGRGHEEVVMLLAEPCSHFRMATSGHLISGSGSDAYTSPFMRASQPPSIQLSRGASPERDSAHLLPSSAAVDKLSLSQKLVSRISRG